MSIWLDTLTESVLPAVCEPMRLGKAVPWYLADALAGGCNKGQGRCISALQGMCLKQHSAVVPS